MSGDIVALKPLPWLSAPKALIGVTAQLKTIIVRAQNIPDWYPYEPNPEGAHRVLYRQFVGDIVPTDDVGDPGDIWVVKNPASHALYARSNTGWIKWPGFRVLLEQLISHPNLTDRYLSCSSGGFKWYSLSTIKNQNRARSHSLCASETVAAFLNRDKDKQRIERGSQHREKRKRVELSDGDESDGEYGIKQEPEEVVRRSKVAAKQRRHNNEIKRLHGEIDNLEEEKTELQDFNRDLKTTNAHLENKIQELKHGASQNHSGAASSLDRLRSDIIDKVGQAFADANIVHNGEDRQKAEVAEKKAADLQRQLVSQSRAHAAHIGEERAALGADFNRRIASLTKEHEKSMSETRVARVDRDKVAQEREKLRVRVEILMEDIRGLREKYDRDMQGLREKHDHDMRRLSGM